MALFSHYSMAMKTKLPTDWNLTPKEAIRVQQTLREQVNREDAFGPIHYVAGADLAFDLETNLAFAGVIVYQFPQLQEVERRTARRTLRFPYVPGLLSFREGPALLAAFEKLQIEPDVILIDGHGIAHPRRFGIACHLGLLLDKPAIGCAKSILVGDAGEPAARAGSTAPLVHQGERVGTVLRTRDRVKPIYVTIGHRVSLESAVQIVTQCVDGYRIPKPTREADHLVGACRRAYQERRARSRD
jgi:deoxyribonuclease V